MDCEDVRNESERKGQVSSLHYASVLEALQVSVEDAHCAPQTINQSEPYGGKRCQSAGN